MFPKKRHISFDWEPAIEDERDAQTYVIVTFPDSSQWAANFYTVTCIESIRNNNLSRGNAEFMWSANPLIIVDKISRTHIEQVIDKSIDENMFDYLFEYFGKVEARQRGRYPDGFFDSESTIHPDLILRQANTLYQMLEHTNDEMKESIKHFLFGDRTVKLEHMKLVPKLQAHNISVIEADVNGHDLKMEWERVFAGGLDADEKENIHFEQFSWHIFSFKRTPCLSGKQAVEAFQQEEKKACYIFYQQYDFASFIADAAHLTAEDLEDEQDIYIVDMDFKWTYVVTHESQCGPYFVKGRYTR